MSRSCSRNKKPSQIYIYIHIYICTYTTYTYIYVHTSICSRNRLIKKIQSESELSLACFTIHVCWQTQRSHLETVNLDNRTQANLDRVTDEFRKLQRLVSARVGVVVWDIGDISAFGASIVLGLAASAYIYECMCG